jgi:hypothetical protein
MQPLRPSWAKLLLNKSPAHCRAAMEEPRKQSAAMALGSYVDWLVFGGNEPNSTVGIPAKARRIAAPVLEYVAKLPAWKGLQEIEFTTNGVLCQIHPDLVYDVGGGGLDLKTAKDTSDDGITRAIELFGYDIQVAAYVEGCGDEFPLLFVETEPPHELRVVRLSDTQLQYGKSKWDKAKGIWKQCWETGQWPGRGSMVSEPSRYRKARNIDIDWNE